tara:strand:+ start:13506 stop:14057 length:552 start_codon:yes stop_codon:yes gene_type:complete
MSWSSDRDGFAEVVADLVVINQTLEERAVAAPLWRWRAGMWVRLDEGFGPIDWSQTGIVHTLDIHYSDEADGADFRLVAGASEWRWDTYDSDGNSRAPRPFEMPVPVLDHPSMRGMMLDMYRDGGSPDAYVRKVSKEKWSVFDTEWVFPDLPDGVWDPATGWPVHHGETEVEALVCALEDGMN